MLPTVGKLEVLVVDGGGGGSSDTTVGFVIATTTQTNGSIGRNKEGQDDEEGLELHGVVFVEGRRRRSVLDFVCVCRMSACRIGIVLCT